MRLSPVFGGMKSEGNQIIIKRHFSGRFDIVINSEIFLTVKRKRFSFGYKYSFIENGVERYIAQYKIRHASIELKGETDKISLYREQARPNLEDINVLRIEHGEKDFIFAEHIGGIIDKGSYEVSLRQNKYDSIEKIQRYGQMA